MKQLRCWPFERSSERRVTDGHFRRNNAAYVEKHSSRKKKKSNHQFALTRIYHTNMPLAMRQRGK
jgi:hypothetical protein